MCDCDFNASYNPAPSLTYSGVFYHILLLVTYCEASVFVLLTAIVLADNLTYSIVKQIKNVVIMAICSRYCTKSRKKW